MKRIDFIAPVEAMRGNLSGKQDLVYPTDDNKAYESPVGSVNYARNYRPSFIGAKRVKDGLKYFAVKTKTACGLTAISKRNMALLGGTGAIVGAIFANVTYKSRVESIYTLAKAAGMTDAKSTRQFISEKIRVALAAKAETIDISYLATHFRAHNPWVYTGGTQVGVEDLTIASAVLVKFWGILATNPIYFTIDGMKGVAHGGSAGDADTFDTVIASRYNVLGLSLGGASGSFHYIMLGDSYVVFEDNSEIYGAVDTRAVTKQAGDESNTLVFFLSDEEHEKWDN